MKSKTANIMSTDEIRWDMFIDDSQLSKRELYLANHCCQPKFKNLLNKAKEFWIQNGGTLSVKHTVEQGTSCIQFYDSGDLRVAMAYYVNKNPDEIKRMDRESAKRYRLRQKHKVALEKVSNGMSPAVYRGRVVWLPVQFPDDKCELWVTNGYYPTVQNNKIVWEHAPQKVKGE